MAKKFVEAAEIPYPCLLGDEPTVKQVPGFKGFPTIVIVDRAGKVRFSIIENDAQTPELINDAVRVLLAEPRTQGRAGSKGRASTQGQASRSHQEAESTTGRRQSRP